MKKILLVSLLMIAVTPTIQSNSRYEDSFYMSAEEAIFYCLVPCCGILLWSYIASEFHKNMLIIKQLKKQDGQDTKRSNKSDTKMYRINKNI